MQVVTVHLAVVVAVILHLQPQVQALLVATTAALVLTARAKAVVEAVLEELVQAVLVLRAVLAE
jgi:hypothetical protein